MAGRAGIEASAEAEASIAVELIAVLVAVADGRPLAVTIDDGRALPSGPFEAGHRSLQSGLRAWVERQTRHPLGYVEQLSTVADSDRRGGTDGARPISISSLGLIRAGAPNRRTPDGVPSMTISPGRIIAPARPS